MASFRPMALHLETERLTLRPWAEFDAENHCALAAERRGGVASPERSRQVVAAQMAAPAQTGIALLVINLRDTADFIGYCGLTAGRSSIDEPELAYELFQRAHGRGYATEAATAVLQAAIDTGRSRLWATVRSWNAPSFRVLDKLAFERHHISTDDKGQIVWLTRALP